MKQRIKKYLDKLPRKKNEKLNGFCANCSYPVNGKFCSNCGQSVKELNRPILSVLSDSLGDALSLDNKFFHTILPLLIKPGFLTREFMIGRRARYTPPFRLYLFLTFFAFLLLTYNHTPDTQIETNLALENQQGDTFDPISFYETLLSEETTHLDSIAEDTLVKREFGNDLLSFSINEETDNADSIVTSKKEITEILENTELKSLVEMWKLNPSLMMDNSFKKLSQTLLIILPLFALILAFFYIRHKRYLIEHLLIALNFHSFIFVIVIVSELIIASKLSILEPIALYLYLLIPIQLLLTMKFYYKQAWIKTIFKFFILSFFYNIMLITGILYSLLSLVD
nr:DUF3667 domain-containing protein [uncultured Marinifilum sp.]